MINELCKSFYRLYENIVVLEPFDSIIGYHRINSVVQSGKKYDIVFNYKDKNYWYLPMIIGRLNVYKPDEGWKKKYLTVFNTKCLDRIGDYKHYKKRIRSNTLYINGI